ncbi:MAG TPA: dienelactone hydrolase family protein [Polyangiaceae bacterium]|nr:dienelactone hydrolase family protein [Polyangiaceae bacterium]
MFLHGATEASPLVVGLHGRGATPENFSRSFAAYPGTIELALVQGFFRVGPGFQWVDVAGSDDEELGTALAASEARLWPIIEKIAHGRPIIVAGFSQGAFMTYALATKHPDAIAYAFPIGGGEPSMLRPRDHAPTAPIHALHGTDDRRVPIAYDRGTMDALQKNGSVADLREFPGTGHVISPDMREDLFAHLQDVAASRLAGPSAAQADGSSAASVAGSGASAPSTEVGLLQQSLLGTHGVADTVQSLTDEVGPRLAGSSGDARGRMGRARDEGAGTLACADRAGQRAGMGAGHRDRRSRRPGRAEAGGDGARVERRHSRRRNRGGRGSIRLPGGSPQRGRK